MPDTPPRTRAFNIAQRRVQHYYAFELRTKPRAALAAHPKRERYFRHEHDRRLATSERVLHGAEIDLRLAAARDAVQKLYAERAQFKTGADSSKRRFLRWI